jgi:GNAT superfamily N-acetyltransferase
MNGEGYADVSGSVCRIIVNAFVGRAGSGAMVSPSKHADDAGGKAMIRIAPLRAADRASWERLWSGYQRFYRVELPVAATEATWERIHNGRIHGLGARVGGDQLVGIVHYLFHEDTWSVQRACYLQDLFVDPSARGSGCATMLIHAVAAAAKSAGASPPYWLTHETNAVARRIYDRVAKNHGFIHYQYAPPDAGS